MWRWRYKGYGQDVSDADYEKMKDDVAFRNATWHNLGPGPLDQPVAAAKKADAPKVEPPAEQPADKKA